MLGAGVQGEREIESESAIQRVNADPQEDNSLNHNYQINKKCKNINKNSLSKRVPWFDVRRFRASQLVIGWVVGFDVLSLCECVRNGGPERDQI